jgi:hypothetical protein
MVSAILMGLAITIFMGIRQMGAHGSGFVLSTSFVPNEGSEAASLPRTNPR